MGRVTGALRRLQQPESPEWRAPRRRGPAPGGPGAAATSGGARRPLRVNTAAATVTADLPLIGTGSNLNSDY